MMRRSVSLIEGRQLNRDALLVILDYRLDPELKSDHTWFIDVVEYGIRIDSAVGL